MDSLEVLLSFTDRLEPVSLKDDDLIRQIPVLHRAVFEINPGTENHSQMMHPITIPFPYSPADFLFRHVRDYVSPERLEGDVSVERYAAAAEMSLAELKDVIELASYLECIDFVQAIGFVIADKLRHLSVEEVAAYMGLEINPEDVVDAEDADGLAWMHPPLDALRERRQNQNQPRQR